MREAGRPAKYKLGKKVPVPGEPGAEAAVTIDLTEQEFAALAALPGRAAVKRRYSVAGGALDVYDDPPGACVFGREFQTPAAARRDARPPTAGREVTGDPAFTGFTLTARAARRATGGPGR